MKIRKKIAWTLVLSILNMALLGGLVLWGSNAKVTGAAQERILSAQEAAALEDVDCILVLGCKVHDDGRPSHMLEDRLKRGLELYQLGAAPKILMSGDHGQAEYDEVNAMKQFATDAGVASADIFMDHAGFSTYESMYRAKEVFGVQKLIIVTQEYHLYRAIYVAQSMGMEAFGVSADYRSYSGQLSRDIREVLARFKDYWTAELKPLPTYLGDKITIDGNGDVTND